MEVRRMRSESEMTQDWSELEALRESLREHMAEIHRLRAALAEGAMQRLTDVQQEMERKPLTDEEIILRMVNLALDDQRELIASWVADMCQGLDANTIAEAIRKGGNDELTWECSCKTCQKKYKEWKAAFDEEQAWFK
jgi:hypothetical protein